MQKSRKGRKGSKSLGKVGIGRPRRCLFESLENRRYLSITPSSDVFDESMIAHSSGSAGLTIEAENIANNLKIVVEGASVAQELQAVTVFDGVSAHFDTEDRVQVNIQLD